MKDGLQGNRAGQANRQQLSEEIGSTRRDTKADQNQEQIEEYRRRDADQSPLFPNHRENEIVVSLRKKSELLPALSKPHAGDAARAEREK